MRRIPRSQRSIDRAIPSSHLLRSRVSPSPCRAALSSSPLLRSASASFSTSTRRNGLLDSHQDKKKHKAFVKRWQKRLLGESEPIGAHVDPYDPTSPVRIAPEEQGEEQEVLVEARVDEHGNVIDRPVYEEAESGEELLRIGSRAWNKQREEFKLVQRFEKLIARPYPIANYNFGPTRPTTELAQLRDEFHQAVVEVFTLNQAGMDLDLTAYPSRGEYKNLPWDISSVKLQSSRTDGLTLTYPTSGAKAELLAKMQEEPEPEAQEEEAEALADAAEESVAEQPKVQVGAGSKDAEAPPARPGALIKQTEGKPFDFMSNRPVPRAKPQETTPEATEAVGAIKTTQPIVEFDIASATEDSQKAIAAIRQTVLEAATQKSEQNVADMVKAVRGNITSRASKSITVVEPVSEAKYRHIPLSDPAIKFALSKRLTQLTGLRISDPLLNSTHSLGDLYAHLVAASKPKPSKVFDMIRLESELHQNKKKPGMEQLRILPNVQIHDRKVSPMQKDRQVGRAKVIDYALAERDLLDIPRDRLTGWKPRRGEPRKEADLAL